jgi:outer membrane protein TolC
MSLKLVRFAPLGVLVLAGQAAAQTGTPAAPAPASSVAGSVSVAGPAAAPPTAAPPSEDAIAAEKAKASGTPLTAEGAAAAAVKTSKTIAVDQAKLKAAAAQVDAAWDNYWPRLSFTARYTRLSPIDPPRLGTDAVRSVVTTAPNGTVITSVGPSTPLIAASSSFAFPVILDQYTFQTSLLVPLSDYVFRTWAQHESALASLDAAKWNAEVTRSAAAADAKVAFYNYLRARGAVLIAKSAVAQASAHLKDMKNRLDAKVVTVADVARVEAGLASAELSVIKTENLVMITEANLRMLMHVGDEEAFSIGEDLDAELPKLDGELPKLKSAAFARRPELKAMDAQIASLEKTEKVVVASVYPRLDAIGNFTYANPNQRIFPQEEKFKATWDVSVQVSWSPNDAQIASDQKKVVSSNVGVLRAAREQIVDGLSLDVTNAFTHVREAEASVVATKVELRAAEEAYRVRKEQFGLGSTTSALLIDAEADVTRARLNHLNARVDLRIARVQLKKSVGE